MKHRFFTLVEMLVVIAVISILAAIVMPGVTSAMRKADEAKAKSDMSALITAIKGFESTYRKYPDCFGSNGKCDDYTKLIKVLSAADSSDSDVEDINPRRIQFLELPAGNPTSGNDAYLFQDPWGTNYEIYVNVDRDRDGIEVGPYGTLRGDVFIYSLGYDAKDASSVTATETKNNVTSWEK